MRFSTERVESVAILHLDGRLTAEADRRWLAAAAAAGTRYGVRHVLLDLRQVIQLDCSGIGQLMQLRQRLHDGRKTCALVAVERRQWRLLETAGLHRVFRMFDDRGDAMAVLGVRPVQTPVMAAGAPQPFAGFLGPALTGLWSGIVERAQTGCAS